MTKDGQDYTCEREAKSGSRTEFVETCLTAAEFEEREKKSQDFLHGLQNTPAPTGTPQRQTLYSGLLTRRNDLQIIALQQCSPEEGYWGTVAVAPNDTLQFLRVALLGHHVS